MSNKDDIQKKPEICDGEVEGSKKSATDLYDNIKCHIKDTNVDIPTEEAVKKAKQWVDDENIK